MLMHHADAGRDGRLAVLDGHGIAIDADLAAVGMIEAVEDRHQCRFAGAVFPMMPWIVPLATVRLMFLLA
jgi:hypothetical protein